MHINRTAKLLAIAYTIRKQLLQAISDANNKNQLIEKISMVEMEYQKIFWYPETSQTDVIRFDDSIHFRGCKRSFQKNHEYNAIIDILYMYISI